MNGSIGKRVRAVLSALAPGRATPSQAGTPQTVTPSDLVDQASAAADPAATGDQAEALRHELQAALSQIFSSAADAILTVDAESRIMMFNHAAEQLFGCQASAALGQPLTRFCTAVLTEPDSGQAVRLAQTGVAGWRLGEIEPVQAIHADGRQIPVEVTVTPVTVRGQQLYTAAIRDVSTRVEMEARHLETTRRLEQALADVQHTQEVMLRQERLKALGQLASGIAHDFNNSLSMIVGFTELLLSDGDTADDESKRRTHLQLIHSAAQDAASVVGRLREFSRPSTFSEALPPVQVNDLVAQAISLSQPRWRGQAQASGRTIRMTAELGQVQPIGGRAGELREALANLIINAVDAMPDGGTLTLRTRMDENLVAIDVADTGTGMSADVRERIFDPFYTTKGDRGTGLGLAMVQGIVQQHHGEIAVSSEPGQGTIFTMRFQPLAIIQEAMAAPPKTERPRVRGLRVLLAEDEPSLRQILTSYLRVDGHAIETAANGEEALAAVQQYGRDIGLVVLDLTMPGMTGLQLLPLLRRLVAGLPIIFSSGYGDADALIQAGANAFLAKPYRPDELVRLVRRVLDAPK